MIFRTRLNNELGNGDARLSLKPKIESNLPKSSHTFTLTASPLLKQALGAMTDIVPDWEAIMRKMKKTDNRVNSRNRENIAGSAAEHVTRMNLLRALLERAYHKGAKIFTHPIPRDTVRAGDFVFLSDPQTQNCCVLNAKTGRLHTEFDALLAIQHPGKLKPEIVVVESKKSTPRLPRHQGIEYVSNYIEHKLVPLKDMFHTHTFSFVLSICQSMQYTRNQKRFLEAFQTLGGHIAMLGIQKHELEAFALGFRGIESIEA
ncbi:hypothetical protein A3I56_00295 [Candidatus Roizmanbacteria bacterium RIFCSPLOWO2_02_FULL_43_10]|uniref:Uncharacterized protein n=3 Tax=Candidatus Roizmaniibacteriota TaxID=1752723 RepID=A0A1F7JU82_9BACT|nr:MAG: hypothetical protein A3D08_00630 [Candidatus Roizmanbacteria bacterium RIFCSPHIGHO2_02_FULL_43_11]OGK38661.1 MAG: hypothetical protein A3F32_02545 [Candidatus Roizmanbacteria bacterium RIFCSPHIGHO2_12_FULL_42_10]OGK59162.1 MAG: hypothetical protein A3I56_00295 [Candidatus Roizmanbacteria bacterium RIFCSPLOWO2_02_FULL_43_10]